MNSLNLFGSDSSDSSDSVQSSRFAANLKKETYDPLLITFNSIRTAKKTNNANGAKDATGTKNATGAKDATGKKDATGTNQPSRSAATLDVFSQKMVLAKPFNSLDDAQRTTQTAASCDYIVYVPTSFEIKKETMNAFYDSKFKRFFEKKTEFNNPAANIFMNRAMFESFVNFSKLNAHKRQIALIEKSYDSAKKEVGPLIGAPTKLLNVRDKESVNINSGEQYAVVYSTPVSQLNYLPFTAEFDASKGRLNFISQKVLTYFSNYFQAFSMHDNGTNSSVGRIPKYLPLLNSNLAATSGATPVRNVNDPRNNIYAAPSRNVEVMSDFLIGVMTNKGLSNRAELRLDKLKAIREKTYLCTFKSTTEYSMNYDTLLQRLYYKYPCYLTPSLIMSSKEIEQMENEVIEDMVANLMTTFYELVQCAVSKCKEITPNCLICAVGVATQEFILTQCESDWDKDKIIQHFGRDIDFGNGKVSNPKSLIQSVSAALNQVNTGTIQQNQLNPLIGAAYGMANAVYAAAKHQAFIAQPNSTTIKDDMRRAMNSVINEQSNFASFMYDNSTLLSIMKYSDQSPAYQPPPPYPKHADYLKTFYKPDTDNDAVKSVQMKEQDEFNKVSDEMLYVIHGPLYFDYEWIFRQDPSLIKHILGEELPPENETKEQDQWIKRIDPLTENVHYINRNPTNSNYPKTRFDNPTIPLPKNIEPTRGFYQDRAYTQTWKELYVSPEQARQEKTSVKDNVRNASKMTNEIYNLDPEFDTWNTQTTAANTVIENMSITEKDIDAIYNWTSPGYYRYELTYTSGEQLTNRFVQLMRPVESNSIQDYTEPNLPTAYPAPLMFITPPMRGPTNTFMTHAWIPDLSSEISQSYRAFMTVDSNGKASLNRGAYMEHLYKMMQLIFKTIVLNAKNTRGTTTTSTTAESNRICIKLMAIGYGSDERNLKMVSDDDKKFIGDSFFYAVRDYSMFYEQTNVFVIMYYSETTQQDVKQPYNEYTSQREAVLLRTGTSASEATTIDSNLKLKIFPADDFFTLKFPIGKLQLQEKDLLYFVNYCSTPRSFIGNCGEWPENIEDIMNNAVLGFSSSSNQKLLESLVAAKAHVDNLFGERNIALKMNKIAQDLAQWNDVATRPKNMVSLQEKIRDKYVKYTRDNQVVAASDRHGKPSNINVSWWKGYDVNSDNALPRNAYMSSFDEHVLILKNLMTRFASNSSFASPTSDCAPYTVDVSSTLATFENAVYAYVEAKKIMTMLSKIKPDNVQVSDKEIEYVKKALAALSVDMSWSMDAKFTTGVCEGAFIPNSSVLHNPFVCTQLLDINKWQYVGFDDIASREIDGTYPLLDRLKKFVDSKIKETLTVGVSEDTTNVDSGTSGILILSKQPSIGLLTKNVKVIFENLFQKNAPLKIDGKEMVLNNYAWPEERLYCKMRNDSSLSSFKSGSTREKTGDFAVLRGLRSSSKRNCIEFPLFVVQLMFTLFEGKLSDMTLLDQASLSCVSDETMLEENFKLVWEQMMQNLKAKEQNFTIANIFKRIGLNSVDLEYEYTAYFDGDEVPEIGTHSASILINCTNAATNPLLRNTNSERLKTINNEVSNVALEENERFYNTPPLDPTNPNQLPDINPIGPYNSIRALAKLAEIFNTVQMHGVAGTPIPDTRLTDIQANFTNLSSGYTPQTIQPGNARIGWNAAKQTQSTMLYVNSTVSIKGTLQDISSDLLSMKSGDKILIKTDTDAAADRVETIKAARLALNRFGRKMKRGGRFLKRAIVEKFFSAYYATKESCEYAFAYVKQLTVIMKTLTPYKLKNCIDKLKVILKNAYKVGIIPGKFVVAVYNGLKAVFEQRNASANAAKAQQAVDDANDALAKAQKGLLDATISQQDAQAALDRAKQELADAQTQAAAANPSAAAAAAGLDDDFLNDIFQQGVAAQAEQDVVEKQAAQDAAEQVAKDAAQQAQDAADAAQKAATNAPADSKWNVFVNAFSGSFEAFESFPASPAAPMYDSADKVAAAAKATLKATNDAKLKTILDDNAAAAKVDEDAAKVDADEAAAAVYNYRFEKSQMWMVTGTPTRNATFPALINIPVYHFRLRASNLSNFSGEEIENDTKLKVEFQKFSKEETV